MIQRSAIAPAEELAGNTSSNFSKWNSENNICFISRNRNY